MKLFRKAAIEQPVGQQIAPSAGLAATLPPALIADTHQVPTEFAVTWTSQPGVQTSPAPAAVPLKQANVFEVRESGRQPDPEPGARGYDDAYRAARDETSIRGGATMAVGIAKMVVPGFGSYLSAVQAATDLGKLASPYRSPADLIGLAAHVTGIFLPMIGGTIDFFRGVGAMINGMGTSKIPIEQVRRSARNWPDATAVVLTAGIRKLGTAG